MVGIANRPQLPIRPAGIHKNAPKQNVTPKSGTALSLEERELKAKLQVILDHSGHLTMASVRRSLAANELRLFAAKLGSSPERLLFDANSFNSEIKRFQYMHSDPTTPGGLLGSSIAIHEGSRNDTYYPVNAYCDGKFGKKSLNVLFSPATRNTSLQDRQTFSGFTVEQNGLITVTADTVTLPEIVQQLSASGIFRFNQRSALSFETLLLRSLEDYHKEVNDENELSGITTALRPGTTLCVNTHYLQGIDAWAAQKRETIGTLRTAATQSPYWRALLDTVAFTEGTDFHQDLDTGDNGYNLFVGYKKFTNYVDHPDTTQKVTILGGKKHGKSLKSSAAGRYQFLSGIWDNIQQQLRLVDFSPESQDLAAIYVARQKGVTEKMLMQNPREAIHRLADIWSSLPTDQGVSQHGQGCVNIETAVNFFKSRLSFHVAGLNRDNNKPGFFASNRVIPG